MASIGGFVQTYQVTVDPVKLRADVAECCELHEWVILHVILDGETQLPEGPGATALLRAAYDSDAGLLRFGGRGR